VDLKLNLHLLEVLDINIKDGFVKLKLNITAAWYDQRLLYVNLNTDIRLNVLGMADFDKVWKPEIIFANKDTNPYYINIDPEINIGFEGQLFNYQVDKISGTKMRQYYGWINPLYWSSIIR